MRLRAGENSFENWMPKGVFGSKKNQLTGCWRNHIRRRFM